MNENPVRKSSKGKKLKFETFVDEIRKATSENIIDTRESD